MISEPKLGSSDCRRKGRRFSTFERLVVASGASITDAIGS
jgi:hypothetical protein